MGTFCLNVRGVKSDERGRLYFDVSTDSMLSRGLSVFVPVVVVKGEPNNATSSVASATSNVSTPTASDLRDLLSEADAILLDSSAAESSCMNAGSSSRVRGSKSRSSAVDAIGCASASGVTGSTSKSFPKSDPVAFRNALAKSLFVLSAIVLSFALGVLLHPF